MKALIAGAGIGGLATGIALALRGWHVQVFERAPALEEIGAGLQISPNGWRVLEALGVAQALRPTVFEPEAIEMRLGRSGRRVFHLPMRGYAVARWGAPFMHVHRADLHSVLAARLETLQPGAVALDQDVTGYAQDGTAVMLQRGDAEDVTGDVLIGADGWRSVIRTQMLGAGRPTYTGNIAWRAVVPVDALGAHAPPPTACIWAGDKRHAVTTRLRGGQLANFVGLVEEPEPAPEGWRVEGDRAQAQAAFAGWHPTIAAILASAPTLNRWALFDRPPLSRWHDGRVALLGDAAHPMLPSLAQGAVMALEDAWVLAGALAARDRVEDGLQAYFDLRIARTARVQQVSRANARLFHKGSTLGQLGFYGPMAIGARLFPGLIHARQDWVYRYDALAVFPAPD
ncbi:MAG: FAD-dependent monooxygenase [Pseudomonadota bacterium]